MCFLSGVGSVLPQVSCLVAVRWGRGHIALCPNCGKQTFLGSWALELERRSCSKPMKCVVTLWVSDPTAAVPCVHPLTRSVFPQLWWLPTSRLPPWTRRDSRARTPTRYLAAPTPWAHAPPCWGGGRRRRSTRAHVRTALGWAGLKGACMLALPTVSRGRTTHLSTVSASLILGHCPQHHQTKVWTQAVMLTVAALTFFCLSHPLSVPGLQHGGSWRADSPHRDDRGGPQGRPFEWLRTSAPGRHLCYRNSVFPPSRPFYWAWQPGREVRDLALGCWWCCCWTFHGLVCFLSSEAHLDIYYHPCNISHSSLGMVYCHCHFCTRRLTVASLAPQVNVLAPGCCWSGRRRKGTCVCVRVPFPFPFFVSFNFSLRDKSFIEVQKGERSK